MLAHRAVIALALWSVGSDALCQDPTGAIEGQILDPDLQSVNLARVSSRNLDSDPNSGPRNVDQWISRSAFRRLNPIAEAGRFGNAGRNIARGPAFTNLDVSVFRTFRLSERTGLQFRVEAFKVANHANFGIPGRGPQLGEVRHILSAGSPRLMQFGLKIMF